MFSGRIVEVRNLDAHIARRKYALRDSGGLQNRQRIEPGVSSAVPTAVAVRGLTS